MIPNLIPSYREGIVVPKPSSTAKFWLRHYTRARFLSLIIVWECPIGPRGEATKITLEPVPVDHWRNLPLSNQRLRTFFPTSRATFNSRSPTLRNPSCYPDGSPLFDPLRPDQKFILPEGAARGQCCSIHDSKKVGDKESMSQKDTGSVPGSRPSSPSPSYDISRQHAVPVGVPPESRQLRPVSTGPQDNHRRTSVDSVLNTAPLPHLNALGAAPPWSLASGSIPSTQSSYAVLEQPRQPPSSASVQSRPTFAATNIPRTALVSDHANARGQAEHRGDISRQAPSPRVSRAASYAGSRERPPLQAFGSNTLPVKRPFDGESTSPRPQLHSQHFGSLPGTPSMPAPMPSRAVSQGAVSLPPGSGFPPPSLITGKSSLPWSQSRADYPQPMPLLPTGASSSASALSGPGNVFRSWQEDLKSGRQQSKAGEEQWSMNLGGDRIPVSIDVEIGSKKASEKRARNANASERFRHKRKGKKEDLMEQEITGLKNEKNTMQMQLNDLIRERDFYRDDRNRLRALVAQTPTISALAQGPPSPEPVNPRFDRPSTSAASAVRAEASVPTLQSEPTAAMDRHGPERPHQRRKGGEHPDFSPGSQALPGPAQATNFSLNVVPHQNANVHTSSATNPGFAAASTFAGTQLPPLRTMDDRTGPRTELSISQPPEGSRGEAWDARHALPPMPKWPMGSQNPSTPSR